MLQNEIDGSMFAQKGDYDSESRLECGEAPTGGEQDPLLVNGINHRSMDTCTENPVSVLSADLHAADSTLTYHQDSDRFQTYVKSESDSKLNEVDDENEPPEHSNRVPNLSVEEGALDRDPSFSHNSVENEVHNGEFGSASDDNSESTETTSIIHSVPKLMQNFTLNVSPGVGNIAAIQNVVQSVSSGNKTLWLPTIISGTAPVGEEQAFPGEAEGTSTPVSQIILSGGGQHFATPLLSGTNSCHVTSNNKYNSKVQILSSITIPKHGSIASNMKGVIHGNYLSQNELNKLNSPVTSQQSKQILHNSVLGGQLTAKTVSQVGRGASAPGHGTQRGSLAASALQLKNVSAVNNRPANKFNNVSSKMTPNPTQQSHVLSRVVPGPKMSLHTGRGLKNNNSFHCNPKVSSRSGSFPNIVQSQNVQTAMPVKIIQQQNLPTCNKGGMKTLPPSRTGIGTKGPANSPQGKPWSTVSTNNVNQKQGAYNKNVAGVVGLQKSNGKNTSQRLVLQQTAGQIVTSNSSQHNRSNAQYYQTSSDTDNTVGYIQNYLGLDNNQHNISSNQNLTAQILQSLSQPKSLHTSVHSQQASHGSGGSAPQHNEEELHNFAGSYDQWRQLHGDPTTLLISDDIPGIEERPNVSDDSWSYHYYTLQLVMLDHTYAGTPKSTAGTTGTATQVITNSSPSNNNNNNNNNAILTPVSSPIKSAPMSLSSPVNCVLPSQSPVHVAGHPGGAVLSGNSVGTPVTYQYNTRDDDDAASVISSIDGDESRPTERNGSDTETAPEVEEEGKTRCVCDFTHDDGYMICCDRCGEWQHVDCMAIDRQNIPDDYMCEKCQPRLVDRKRARSIQMRKREELTGLGSSGSESSGGSLNANRNKRPAPGAPPGSHKKRPLTVTTYSNTIGGVSRTVPMLAAHQSPPYNVPATVTPLPSTKRGPKRPRRVDNGRKGPKRKIPEKKLKRKSDLKYRSKYFSPTSSSQQTNQWNDSYELAMTNHYSPELRAKIARFYSNKTANNSTSMSVVLTAHHCTTVPHAGGKILIATKDLKENTPIIELRGKYMLSTQHKPQPQPTSRAGSQRPGPFLFFYRFPRDSTQVCIDTRTYGNEARFVRRSCKPNAELQHCIIKGALHVYLVTINSVQSNTEISIRHESSGSSQSCACGNPKNCRQVTSSSSGLSHRNNGASSERRGRTRHASSSALFSAPTSTLPKENISPKQLSSPNPKVDRRRRSEPESVFNSVIKQEVDEKFVSLPIKKEEPLLVPKNEIPLDVKPIIEPELPILKEDVIAVPKIDIPDFIKKEKDLDEVPHVKLSPVKAESTPEPLEEENEKTIKDEIVPAENEPSTFVPKDVKSPELSLNSATQSLCKLKEKEKCDTGPAGRTAAVTSTPATPSTPSTRTTRASSSAAAAGESADEKSDSQTETKVQSAKDKKKMTREERKMEAIVKAIERMEKAEQRKLEIRDKQTKRRESDPQQSCSVTSTSESKDLSTEPGDDMQSMLKGRRRRKGRARTSSQTSGNRLNSVDSDMVTSEDEHTSLMSPPRSSLSVAEHFSDIAPLSSEEANSFRELAETNIALGESLNRMKVGLSSACLLVEAAVGPLETTFKFPKTKKTIMNEWLKKSPEPNMSYEYSSSLEFTNPTDNNNSTHHFTEKPEFLAEKSIENLVRVANTMIGSWGRGVISADSTPEKLGDGEHSESEVFNDLAVADSSCSPSPAESPLSYSQRAVKRVSRDLTRDPVGFSPEKNRTPKKPRKNSKMAVDPGPLKRSLRSSAVSSSSPPPPPPEALLPPPAQHSAKKRWLRQAISEESDSPTAESPPNEMVTPLKKRRLARESLSLEHTSFGHSDDAQCPPLMGTPPKDVCGEISFRHHSIMSFTSPEKLPPPVESVHADEDEKQGPLDPEATPLEETNQDNISSSSPNTFSSSFLSVEKITQEKNNSLDMEKMDADDNCRKPDIKEGSVPDDFNVEKLSDEKENGPSLEFCNFQPAADAVIICDPKSEIVTEDTNTNDRVYVDSSVGESKSECTSNVHSTETSGNSSPILDEMDDIQKKIHSFHTENIQILKIRNKKQPKEKRKKVNLNFDLSVLDDQTVEVKLKPDKEAAGVSDLDSKADSPAESVPESCQNASGPPTPDNSTAEGSTETAAEPSSTLVESHTQKDSFAGTQVINDHFPSANLFSENFRIKPFTEESSTSVELSASIPDMNVIKNAIDMTTSLETSVFKDGTVLNSADEYKNVQEILSRVNQMDSRNSVLLSGVLKDAGPTLSEPTTPTKLPLGRSNDPRLNPPPVETPKPVRRKLSINEYRRRHSMAHPTDGSSPPSTPGGEGGEGGDGEGGEGGEGEPEEEDMSRLEKNLEDSINNQDVLSNINIGVFNAQPTMLERQREKLNERLRREFGLHLPEDEETCGPALPGESESGSRGAEGSGEAEAEVSPEVETEPC